MAGLNENTPVKSLDGTVRPLGGVSAGQPTRNAELKAELASRPKPNGKASSSGIPHAGQILTGKQEHCEWGAEIASFISF